MPTIAWVEDDVDVIDALLFPLEQRGFRIDKYRSVGEAVSAIDQVRQADIIVVDMLLPPGSYSADCGSHPGVELVRHLTQVAEISKPIVVLTVVASDVILNKVRALGVSTIVRKPVLPSVLENTLKALLG